MTFEQIQKELNESEICCELNENLDGTLSVYIDFGDWKHDHIYCDYIMKSCGYRLIEEVVTESDDSDCYSSVHYYAKDDAQMKLNDIREEM